MSRVFHKSHRGLSLFLFLLVLQGIEHASEKTDMRILMFYMCLFNTIFKILSHGAVAISKVSSLLETNHFCLVGLLIALQIPLYQKIPYTTAGTAKNDKRHGLTKSSRCASKGLGLSICFMVLFPSCSSLPLNRSSFQRKTHAKKKHGKTGATAHWCHTIITPK